MAGKILSIDYGDVRTGIAVSDALGWTAQPVETIYNNENDDVAINRIIALIIQFNAVAVLYGMPFNMNGTKGIRAEKTATFIDKLKDSVEQEKLEGIDFIQWDERLTSVIANRTMHELGIKTAKKKGIVDQIAAVQLLQGYLDSIR